jgi:hypothetical protein
MGEAGVWNITIDLVWRNMVAQIQGTFVGAEVNFRGSQESNHALIQTIASTPVPVCRVKEDQTNRFDANIDAEAWDEWNCILHFVLPPPLHCSGISP